MEIVNIKDYEVHRTEIDRFIQIILTNHSLLRDLRIVQSLGLPEACIAAGYIRNYVWDYLHGYRERTPLHDVDVLYYDPNDLREVTEKKLEHRLREALGDYKWSVKNQARMHLRNNVSQYSSIEDAMKHWPETATAVGLGMVAEGCLKLYAPMGLKDLLDMIVRRSPHFEDLDAYRMRVASKGWLTRWPKLTYIE